MQPKLPTLSTGVVRALGFKHLTGSVTLLNTAKDTFKWKPYCSPNSCRNSVAIVLIRQRIPLPLPQPFAYSLEVILIFFLNNRKVPPI